MKTMSAIYQKVRHRLNDDWAYGNGRWRKCRQDLNTASVQNNYFDLYCVFLGFLDLFLWREGGMGVGGHALHIHLNLSQKIPEKSLLRS